MKLPLVMVEWVDAESEATWAESGDMADWAEGLPVATEVGWVYDENDEVIVLVSAFFGDGTFGNRTKIPKGMIKSKRKLGFHNERKRRTR